MPEKQPPSGVELKVIQLTRNVEAIDVKVEALDQRLDRLAQSVDALTGQVGRFTEGLTKLENIVSSGFEDVKLTTRQQATHIDRLIGLVEQQAMMINRLLERN